MIPSMLRRLSFEIFHQLLSEQSKLFHDSLLRLVDLGSLNTDFIIIIIIMIIIIIIMIIYKIQFLSI